jgi:hypothetical protein
LFAQSSIPSSSFQEPKFVWAMQCQVSYFDNFASRTSRISHFYQRFITVSHLWILGRGAKKLNCTKIRGLSPRAKYTGRVSDRRLSSKLVQNFFAEKRCHVVSVTDNHGRILGFLDWNRYYFFQVAPQLYSRGWVDPFPDPLLLRKSGSAVNRTRDLWICSQKLWLLDHRGGGQRHYRQYNRADSLSLSK